MFRDDFIVEILVVVDCYFVQNTQNVVDVFVSHKDIRTGNFFVGVRSVEGIVLCQQLGQFVQKHDSDGFVETVLSRFDEVERGILYASVYHVLYYVRKDKRMADLKRTYTLSDII
jgi:hypothetical protein